MTGAETLVTLGGTVNLGEGRNDLYVSSAKSITVTEDFEATTPIDMYAPVGKFADCAGDKAAMFASETHSITWKDAALNVNGLIQAQDGTKFATFAEAMESGDHCIFALLGHHIGDAEITGKVWLNLNGKDITGNITGTGTLYGYDTSSDDYKGADGRIIGTVSCNVAPHFQGSYADICTLNRYMAIADETGYTFHRFYLGVTHATIRPDSTAWATRLCSAATMP